MSNIFCGIDPGQKTTTIAVLIDGVPFFKSFTQPYQYSIMQVVNFSNAEFQRHFLNLEATHKLLAAGFESPAFFAKSQSFAFGSVYATGVLNCCKFFDLTFFVSPSTLKLATTGSGKATKRFMLKEVQEGYCIDLHRDHNLADALALAHLAMAGWHIENGLDFRSRLGDSKTIFEIMTSKKKVSGKLRGMLQRDGDLVWRKAK